METEILQKLKEKLRAGDREIIATRVNCSPRTLDEALNGRNGRKSEKALLAFVELLEERKEEARLLASRAEDLI